MPHVLVIIWLSYTGSVGYEPRKWEEVVMQEFSSKETCEAAEAKVRKAAPRVGSRPCKSLEMQINRRFSQEIHPAKSLRN